MHGGVPLSTCRPWRSEGEAILPQAASGEYSHCHPLASVRIMGEQSVRLLPRVRLSLASVSAGGARGGGQVYEPRCL